MGWKKLTIIVLAAAVLICGAIALSMKLTKQQQVEMEVNQNKTPQAGDTTTLTDMENMPLYYDDEEVLLLPVRNVVEGLGGSVSWDAEKKATEISYYGKKLLLNRGSSEAQLNGYDITLKREVEAINGCLYVTSDVFSEYFATKVIWDSDQQLVTIQTGDNSQPVIASCVISGEDGERSYSAEYPVVVGLNDGSFEKNLNNSWKEYAEEAIASFLPEEEMEEDTSEASAEDAAAEEAAASEESGETAENNDAQEEPLPKQVHLRFMKGYCSDAFLSLCWEKETDGKLEVECVNIDLLEQRKVTLSDLTNGENLTESLAPYATEKNTENYYISAEQELMLMENMEDGTYTSVPVPFEFSQSVWKEKYRFLLGI
ncbi:copper amine oxidase N-terminal domain-containing protein [Anaerotignum lactatifermentans]|uniref:Copper amine oxidase N-terminal domain-containing protein n=1 Tax=Anaerotignum lactatifermentans TaxID=160404 RepID=A0ABS2G6N7_9FIRM|nr:copper amine oxidase N-terminal domain-containing protein [Anaerotignum lactatifermentans]MBM6828777.1 copper amine oxidase N-terminal domain-containing protein [Anaerotignum lactatifermentans]MBM6877104.1 copper amine oxidase N-terminal domain-containing protein [Anaerotignum lactatifermentans]MBM6950359.1 copper amine oxidase N-terminal domain-containing protein [Anaerotignum lactatifermentans]